MKMDDFSESAKKAAREAGAFAAHVYDTSVTGVNILAAKNRIDTKMKQLGYLVYGQSKKPDSDEPLPEIKKRISELDELYDKLDELEKRQYENKHAKKCPNCGIRNESGESVCTGCGTKL